MKRFGKAYSNQYSKTVTSKSSVMPRTTIDRPSSSMNKELLELDNSKIYEFIKILEEHMNKCMENEKYAEAETAKKKLEQFEKLKEEKQRIDMINRQNDEKKQLEIDHNNKIEEFNNQYDSDLNLLNEKFETAAASMHEQHGIENQEMEQKFEQNFPYEPKYSPDVVNKKKILQELVKKKEFGKAHEVQTDIAELVEKENSKWMEYREKKLSLEREKFKTKHDNEVHSFNLKHNLAVNEFNNRRKTEEERLVKRYKNNLKELEYLHKCEENEFGKPKKFSLTTRGNNAKTIINHANSLKLATLSNTSQLLKGQNSSRTNKEPEPEENNQ